VFGGDPVIVRSPVECGVWIMYHYRGFFTICTQSVISARVHDADFRQE